MCCYVQIEIYSVIRKEIIIETLNSIQIGKANHAPYFKGLQFSVFFPIGPSAVTHLGPGPCLLSLRK